MVEARRGKRGGGGNDAAAVLPEKNEAVKVAIRCRPMNDKENAAGHQKVVNINH